MKRFLDLIPEYFYLDFFGLALEVFFVAFFGGAGFFGAFAFLSGALIGSFRPFDAPLASDSSRGFSTNPAPQLVHDCEVIDSFSPQTGQST